MRLFSIWCMSFIFTMALYGDLEELNAKLFDKKKDCISIENCGELGNGMFRAAFAICQALENDYSFLINRDYKNRYPEVFSRFPLFTPAKEFTGSEYVHFVSSIEKKINPNKIISGFPHSYLYFDRYRNEICELFKPSDEMLNYLKEKHSNILNIPDKYVGLHMRTYSRNNDGPLLFTSKEKNSFTRCSFEYYDKAIGYFPEDSIFVVFSDNIECAKKLLKKYKRDFIFISGTIGEDFYLLSLFKNIIMSNSSFSWWAAYLHPELNKKIVNPWPWHNFSDIGVDFLVDGKPGICPPEWKEYPLGDASTDGFDDIIRKHHRNRR